MNVFEMCGSALDLWQDNFAGRMLREGLKRKVLGWTLDSSSQIFFFQVSLCHFE